jgi:hypothetical protein
MALTRRSVLVGAALSPFAARAAASGLRAVVHLGGEVFAFDAADAEDLGAFVSPAGFRQSCFRSTHPTLPLTVFFRPDEDSDRLEVVFELGHLWNGRTENLGPYRAEIQRGGKTIAAEDVPRHFWFSRWRWQSAPRPIARVIPALRERGLIPPYANRSDGIFGRAKDQGRPQRYRLMALARIEPKMGSTGERADIGLVTETQARFLCTEASDALATMRAQAEAASTLPWHLRDERTGAPVDLDRHAKMSWYWNPEAGDPHVSLAQTGIEIDSAHQPALAYVPYLLSGDPYHLEDLQFAANYNRGALPPQYRLSVPQPRTFAWSLRTLAQAARITPETAPKWLLPAAYFRDDLARTREWFEATYVESRDPLHAVFRATDSPAEARDEPPRAPGGTWISPWQHEFVVAVLGWVVLMGFDDWRKAFLWALGGTLARSSGGSGWPRSRPSPYRLILKSESDGSLARSWEEAWRLSSTRAGWRESEDLVEEEQVTAIYTRGALALGARLGVSEAKAPLAWLTEQLRQQAAEVPYKWRLV